MVESREQVTESFLRPRRVSHLDDTRFRTDEARSSSGASGHWKEYRCNEPGADTPAKNTTQKHVSEKV